MAELTERRKGDRKKMADMVKALCDELGAECVIRDCATHIWPDGSRPLPEHRNRLVLSIQAGDATVGIDFEGGSHGNTDNYCMPWNVAYESEARFSVAFGVAVGDSVNPHHRRKCMGFAPGIDNLLERLRAAIECVNAGKAFLREGEPIPFQGSSYKPADLIASGYTPIGKPDISISASCYQRVAYELQIPQSELVGFRHPDGYWQLYRKPTEQLEAAA